MDIPYKEDQMIAMPVKELKDGAKISAKCHELNEPITITKNGYDDMVIMSSETFERYEAAMKGDERRLAAKQRELQETLADIQASIAQIEAGEGVDGFQMLAEMRKRHALS